MSLAAPLLSYAILLIYAASQRSYAAHLLSYSAHWLSYLAPLLYDELRNTPVELPRIPNDHATPF
jgi:hypothetical protein